MNIIPMNQKSYSTKKQQIKNVAFAGRLAPLPAALKQEALGSSVLSKIISKTYKTALKDSDNYAYFFRGE